MADGERYSDIALTADCGSSTTLRARCMAAVRDDSLDWTSPIQLHGNDRLGSFIAGSIEPSFGRSLASLPADLPNFGKGWLANLDRWVPFIHDPLDESGVVHHPANRKLFLIFGQSANGPFMFPVPKVPGPYDSRAGVNHSSSESGERGQAAIDRPVRGNLNDLPRHGGVQRVECRELNRSIGYRKNVYRALCIEAREHPQQRPIHRMSMSVVSVRQASHCRYLNDVTDL